MQQEKSCSLVVLLKCLGQSRVEVDPVREMATIPPIASRQLHKMEYVIAEDFFSHACHAALEQSGKDASKPV